MRCAAVVLAIPLAMLATSLRSSTAEVQPAAAANGPRPSLWAPPTDVATRDLFAGPWGLELGPDATAVYRFVAPKRRGVNPGMTVRDPQGREWSVKQAAEARGDEGPVEVVLSRVLSAVGYHQPPVYYLREFTLRNDWGTHVERGGRFRVKLPELKELANWEWQANPFIGTPPYRGLLVILMLFNSYDFKDSNNSLYEYRDGTRVEQWYVVRDLGSSLGSTRHFGSRKNDPVSFARDGFIRGLRQGFVEFEYEGWHDKLVRQNITLEDVSWALDLLNALTPAQWRDAFRAGGYSPPVAEQFISSIKDKIAQGQRLLSE